MIDNSTFSLTIENYEYVWKVKTLLRASKNLSVIDWPVSDFCLQEWPWAEEDIKNHIERCLEADLNYPILIWDGKIIDGCHRIIKAIALGQRKVKAKVIRDIPAPDEILDFVYNNYENDARYNFSDVVKIVKTKLSL
tara:strand:+ start:11190 stop:11600 length:411 start_codon:yes stop_codon:yes gene_type:complete